MLGGTFTKQSSELTKQMYHSMNNVDFNTIKILKYAVIKLFVLLNIFSYFDPLGLNACSHCCQSLVELTALLRAELEPNLLESAL